MTTFKPDSVEEYADVTERIVRIFDLIEQAAYHRDGSARVREIIKLVGVDESYVENFVRLLYHEDRLNIEETRARYLPSERTLEFRADVARAIKEKS